MITGSLYSPSIRWEEYLCPKFKPYLNDQHKWKSCGSATLSLITRQKAHLIEKKLPKSQRHWSTLAFKRYLLSQGYTTIEVTKRNITNTYWKHYPLQPNHIVVMNIQLNTLEASWYVLYQNTLYHNMDEEEDFDSLFFLNKPPQNVIVVYHPKWKGKHAFKKDVFETTLICPANHTIKYQS